MSDPQTVQDIALADIRENPVALRPVNREAEGYIGLVDSIKTRGFISTVTVRPAKDEETGADFFELIDGLHRFTAAGDAGLTTIPCIVKDVSKQECMEMQLMLNVHKIDTRPIEFTHQLMRMIEMSPTMTNAELASRLGKSTAWISNRLGLLKLDDGIQKLVDESKITLSNAFALAKLPKEEQIKFVDMAMTEPPAEFIPKIQARAKEIRDAKRAGRDPGAVGFQPVAHLQKKVDIEVELDTLSILKGMLKDQKAKTPEDGAKVALNWVLSLDTRSITVQKAKYAERKAKTAEAADKRKLERADQKIKDAAAQRAALEEKYKAPVADAVEAKP